MDYRNGLPKPRGASDYMDSAHAAGMLAIFGSPKLTIKFGINQYGYMYAFDKEGNLPKYCTRQIINNSFVRNPDESPSNNPLNFTRDQSIPLAAGFMNSSHQGYAIIMLREAVARKYRAQNTEADLPGTVKKFPNGADLLTPSVMNHYRICAGQKPKLLGKIWLCVDILFNALFTPMSEPNNMIVMALTAGPFYVKLMRATNKKLEAAIKEYWSEWRNEPELAQLMIDRIKA